MSACKFCSAPIFFAWNQPFGRWFPGDLESITGAETEFEGGVILESWHRRHRCNGFPPPPKSPFGYEAPRPAEPKQPTPGSPHATLYVALNAPLEVIRAAHRALAAIHHPDVGGDGSRMVAINAAYEELSRKR